MRSLIGEEKFQELSNLFESNSKQDTVKIEAPSKNKLNNGINRIVCLNNLVFFQEDKNDRKLVHNFVKTYYKNFNSNTITDKETQLIEICHNKFNVT